MFALDNTKLLKTKRRRVWEIDFLRGLCIFLMVFDHSMFDFMWTREWFGVGTWSDKIQNSFLVKMQEAASWWWTWKTRVVIQMLAIFMFLLLSGISCSLSRGNFKRLFKMSFAAYVVIFATYFADVLFELGIQEVFGILTIMSISLIFYLAIDMLIRLAAIIIPKIFKNRKLKRLVRFYGDYAFLLFGALLILGGILIKFYMASFPPYDTYLPEPPLYYPDKAEIIDILLGKLNWGSDSYGIMPYTGYFLLGAYVGKTFYNGKKSLLPNLDKSFNKAFCFVGRHTIWVYLAHQIIIFLAVVALSMALGYRF